MEGGHPCGRLLATVVYGCWGGLHPKQDSFCISPGHISPPSPSQIQEPVAGSVHAEESCGLWSAVPSLGTSRKIKSGLQEGIKRPHTTFGLLLGGVSLGQDRGISLPGGDHGVSPLPPVSGGLGRSLVPVAVQVTLPGIGSRDEVTFPDSWDLGWPGAAVCVMAWAISFASLEQVVTPRCPSATRQGWALVTNSHVDVPCLSFPVCKTEIILPSLPLVFRPALRRDLSLPESLNRTKCLCCL